MEKLIYRNNTNPLLIRGILSSKRRAPEPRTTSGNDMVSV